MTTKELIEHLSTLPQDAEQRAGGRTTFSETLNLKWIGALGLVTFNGATISNVQDGYITWTTSTITFRGTTIDA